MESHPSYDVIVVGGGIAGASLAYSLGKSGRRVLLMERDLSEPDTFRGELLQPGGIRRLKELGLEDCIEGIDGHKCYGYVVFRQNEGGHEHVPIDFPKIPSEDGQGKKNFGIGFHHGRFVMNLRKALAKQPTVTVMEANVLSLIEEGEEVLGVTFRLKGQEETKNVLASLTVDCTGCFSRLRSRLTVSQSDYKSHFVALILKDCVLPYPNYGYVTLAEPAPVLCYTIATNEVRMLIGVPDPLPSVSKGDLKRFIQEQIAPQLPEFFQGPLAKAAEEQLRSVPCRTMPTRPVQRPGALSVGDSLNMRHPLTGGGMTVAFTDVTIITRLLAPFEDLSDRRAVMEALAPLYDERRHTASTINILAQALYDVFCGSNTKPELGPMKDACFAYFPYFGTDCLAMVGGLKSNPLLLLAHFFAVAFFTVLLLMVPYPTPKKMYQGYLAFLAAFHIIKPLVVNHYFTKELHTFSEVKLVD